MNHRLYEAERHIHNYESWFEEAGTPTATHFADRIGTAGGGGAFRITSGSPGWGTWVQLLGSADTPARTGMTKYDPHRLSISATSKASVYFIRFGYGASGAAALTAGTYSDYVFVPTGITGEQAVLDLMMRRKSNGTLLWAQCYNPTDNGATLDFYFGIHEYLV